MYYKRTIGKVTAYIDAYYLPTIYLEDSTPVEEALAYLPDNLFSYIEDVVVTESSEKEGIGYYNIHNYGLNHKDGLLPGDVFIMELGTDFVAIKATDWLDEEKGWHLLPGYLN